MVELAYIHCTVAANSPGATIGYVGQDDDEMLCSLSCVSCGPVDLLYISKLILDANQLAVSDLPKAINKLPSRISLMTFLIQFSLLILLSILTSLHLRNLLGTFLGAFPWNTSIATVMKSLKKSFVGLYIAF